MTKRYFINGKYFGESEVPAERSWEQNQVWFCQSCGDTYARMVVEGREREPVLYNAMLGCCEKCIPAPWAWNQVPGSVWQLSDREANTGLPLEVVRRELLLTIKWWELQ